MRLARVRLRRLLSRLDRTAPAWLTWLPSWGSSVLIHALLLVILATYFYASNRPRSSRDDLEGSIVSLADHDFTSLVPAAQSGDPFTDAQTDETPSISMDPTGTSTGQPNLVAGLAFSPNMNTPERISADRQVGLSDILKAPRIHTEDMTAPFSGRSGPSKVQLIRREGGTTASERAVQEGLAWIARHQRADGGWSLDTEQRMPDLRPAARRTSTSSPTPPPRGWPSCPSSAPGTSTTSRAAIRNRSSGGSTG